MDNETQNEVIIFQDDNGEINLNVSLTDETVWLNQKQLCLLFDRDKSVISRHTRNIFKEGELDKSSTVAKNATVQKEGDREVVREVDYYNLDMIISLGYRVNSKRATQFRIWATKVLKDHIVKGYSVNENRLKIIGLNELTQTIELLKNTIDSGDLALVEAKGLLDVILNYAKTWTLLQGYDEDSLVNQVDDKEEKFVLDFDEAREAIDVIKKELIAKGEASALFGQEKANELDGIIRNIYQTFGGDDLIPTVEEKAAHLLYYIIKDHPFNDGNKRIGAFLFILFLSKNDRLYKPNGELKINDNALVALSLMTAKSDPMQKDTVVSLIVNILGD